MKKIMVVATLTLSFAFMISVSSQAQAFKNGDMVANAGLGFGWYSYGYGTTSFPAVSLSLEKGIKELDFGTLALGGIVGFKHAKYAWSSNYDWSWTDYIVAARGAIHADLLKVDKLDTYGGLAVGLRFQTWKYYDYFNKDYKESKAHPLFAFYVGGRYYFTEKFAAFGELGYGLGYLTLGLSLKL